MNKENVNRAQTAESNVRITRSRSKALETRSKVTVPTQKRPLRKNKEPVLRENLKRPVPDENLDANIANAGPMNKRKTVLKDVTNLFVGSSYTNHLNLSSSSPLCCQSRSCNIGTHKLSFKRNVTNVQTKRRAVRGSAKKSTKLAPLFHPSTSVNTEKDMTVIASHQVSNQPRLVDECAQLVDHNDNVPVHSRSSVNPGPFEEKGEENAFSNRICKLGIKDIDCKQKDPLMCSLYATDINNMYFVAELKGRASPNYMETVQREITRNMREILVDWLVEVSEEYKLLPSTLYLTVDLIDRFMSRNYITKPKLQLLGVACMLIASKYVELTAPHVEQFCFITDNSYTKRQVLKMETRVLSFLNYRLTNPTVISFMTRFVQAAQTLYKDPCSELEFLANYLAELTLVDYNFIKFLPSLVAASVIFLARWTIDSSSHPWNPTLEYYTHYKATQLKTSVCALQDLQMNIKGSSFNAVWEKYQQLKFKRVANLTSKKLDQSLFSKPTSC